MFQFFQCHPQTLQYQLTIKRNNTNFVNKSMLQLSLGERAPITIKNSTSCAKKQTLKQQYIQA